jgi:hypothetical protein
MLTTIEACTGRSPATALSTALARSTGQSSQRFVLGGASGLTRSSCLNLAILQHGRLAVAAEQNKPPVRTRSS